MKMLAPRLVLLVAVTLWGSASPAAQPPAGPSEKQPTVVELFTSQGCSSCPPANDTLSHLATRLDILALSFGVTYWDNLGWNDTFATPAYTQRQYDYAKGLHHAGVYTPQMVIDGRHDTTGLSTAKVEPLLFLAGIERPRATNITLNANWVSLSAGKSVGAQVWLVRYDPRIVEVPVKRGENGGRTLPHRNVVRELIRLGDFNGAATRFGLSKPTDPNLKTAIIVQAGLGGAIIASAKQ